jgi:uroporphyrin-III C-methyltransferase/precorrin-2 dehydrogenase/sirohydrochlorin ferrochelatase
VLPLGLSSWAEAAKAWRPLLKRRLADFGARRAFWKRFTETAWTNVDRVPGEADFNALMEGLPQRAEGSVTLVGAGPGDPELLTLKAVRALQNATVILYDDLVGAEILELARREAKRVAVGKTGHGPSVPQAEINARIVALARAGETVVRLKGGDPLIFGRATEEIDACRAAGISVSLVPGISAAQGAAASLGISLTERTRARRIQYVTGHATDGELPSDLDWSAVADRRATTIIYMPRKTLREFVRKALGRGLDPATPAVAIASATRPSETTVCGTVSDIAALAETLPAGAPVTVILGWVARDLAAAQPADLLPFRKAS